MTHVNGRLMPEFRNRDPSIDRRASANPYEFLNRREALTNKSTNTKTVSGQADSETAAQHRRRRTRIPMIVDKRRRENSGGNRFRVDLERFSSLLSPLKIRF